MNDVRSVYLRRSWGLLLCLGLSLSLGGCGFKLRGDQRFSFASLHSGFSAYSDMGAQFRRTVRQSESTKLVDLPGEAQARLIIVHEAREKEIVGLSTSGRPREYQLRLRLNFRVLGPLSDDPSIELLGATEILLRRDVSTSDLQYSAKQQEEEILYKEMQGDLIQQLMRRLAAIRMPVAPIPSKAP